MEWEPVVGLEVHAELRTRSKMFCGCAVVDSTVADPNTSTCPVCLGMPGSLPVINRKAVDMALRVALAISVIGIFYLGLFPSNFLFLSNRAAVPLP